MDIKSLISGVVQKKIYDKKYFGTQCLLCSNPKFAGGVDEKLYHSYCHLHEITVNEGGFIEAGKVIGKMGNSGGCYTGYDSKGNYTGIYRPVTKSEQDDKHCNYGVHLHLWFYQDCAPGKQTKLLKQIKSMKIISSFSLGDTHFYQWSKLIIAPRVIFSYFKKIQEGV
jgi:hypothetical protein